MLLVFSLDQLNMLRSAVRMTIDLNHTNPSFKFDDAMDLYQLVCTYCGQNEDTIPVCDPVCDESEVIK